jgi:hypothetical protein
LRELHGHGGRYVDHACARRLQADLGEQVAEVFNALARVQVALEVMTAAAQAAGHQNAVGALFEGVQHGHHINAAGAGQFDNLDGRGIGLPRAARQVGRRVGAVPAAEGNDLGLKRFAHVVAPSRACSNSASTLAHTCPWV